MNVMGKTVAKVWTFESDSSPGKTYEALQYTDGSTSCGCMGWTRRVAPDGSRSCKHTRAIDQGVADTQAMAHKDYTVSAAAVPAKAAQASLKKAAATKVQAGRRIEW